MTIAASRPLRARVLVCDGDTRTALAAVRSLVAAGHEVWAAAPGRSLAGVSRGVHPVRLTQDPLRDTVAYVDAIASTCIRLQIDVLLPVTDASAEAILRHAELLPPRVRVPLPPFATFRRGTDKAAMQTLAAESGFSIPFSVTLDAAEDLERVIAALTWPAIMKPHRSVLRDSLGRTQRADVQFVDDADALRVALQRLPPAAYPVLLQERIVGDGEGCFAMRWNGALRLCFAHRRLREKPPAGGISVFRESIAVPDALRAATTALLDALDWNGVAMIECKRDAMTGRHVFIELNGRLWGSLQLAIDAGADFPALLVAAALGAPDESRSAVPFRAGVRSQWIWGDLDHLYARFFKSATALHLAPGATSRAATLAGVVAAFVSPRSSSEIERWHDPLPGLLEWARRLRIIPPLRSPGADAPPAPALRDVPAADPMPRRTPLREPRG